MNIIKLLYTIVKDTIRDEGRFVGVICSVLIPFVLVFAWFICWLESFGPIFTRMTNSFKKGRAVK